MYLQTKTQREPAEERDWRVGLAPGWRAPKTRGKNRSKCVPWLQWWRLPPQAVCRCPATEQEGCRRADRSSPMLPPPEQTMMFHLFHMKTHVTKIMIIITFFSCLPERNGARDRERKRERQSVDLCFVSHWTKETLTPPTLPLSRAMSKVFLGQAGV